MDGTGVARYQVRVSGPQIGRREFGCAGELYEFAPYSGWVRVFYFPRRRWAVNLESLRDPPDGHSPGDDDLARLPAARRARDPAGTAEARAQFAAMKQRCLPAGQTGAAPPAAQPAGPRAIAEAIAGDWHSPFLSISLRPD